MARGKTPEATRSGATAPAANRRTRLASFEAARKKDARRRAVLLFVICGVLAMALLSYPVYLFVQDYRASSRSLADLGVPAAAAGCDPVQENAATGNQQHEPTGTKITYAQSPPDSGAHWDTPAPFTKNFYAVDDRPEVETLVHNLEHGYTLVWYRDSAPADQITALKQIAKTFARDEESNEAKFIAAPWSAADGAALPDGKNVVLARWTANPGNPADTTAQQGVRQTCGAPSGQAIADFMAKYPEANSPEPNGA